MTLSPGVLAAEPRPAGEDRAARHLGHWLSSRLTDVVEQVPGGLVRDAVIPAGRPRRDAVLGRAHLEDHEQPGAVLIFVRWRGCRSGPRTASCSPAAPPRRCDREPVRSCGRRSRPRGTGSGCCRPRRPWGTGAGGPGTAVLAEGGRRPRCADGPLGSRLATPSWPWSGCPPTPMAAKPHVTAADRLVDTRVGAGPIAAPGRLGCPATAGRGRCRRTVQGPVRGTVTARARLTGAGPLRGRRCPVRPGDARRHGRSTQWNTLCAY